MTAFPEDENLAPLSEPESQLLAAARAGTILRLGPKETIRATVIRALVCAAAEDWPVAAEGVRVVGGCIVGRLAFAGRTLQRPLWIDDAEIPDGIDLTASRTRLLSFEKSRINGDLKAASAQVDGSLLLNGATLKGVCEINRSNLTGNFLANNIVIENSDGDAIDAQGSNSTGIFLNSAIIKGACDIAGAIIVGQFSAIGATFENPAGRAINAQGSNTAGMFLDRATLKGACSILGARISGQFSANNAILDCSAGRAIDAQGINVAGIFLRNAMLRGACDINSATITGQFSATGATFDSPGIFAINAQQSSSAGIFLDKATIKGLCDIAGATIKGPFSAIGTSFENPDGNAIRADTSQIEAWFMRPSSTGPGEVPQPTRLRGALILARAKINKQFEIIGADLAHKETAFDARGIEASGAFLIGGSTRIAGGIDFATATIRGRLDFTGSRIAAPAQAENAGPLPNLADDAAAFMALDLDRLTEPFDLVAGDEAGREAREGLVDVGASLVSNG